MYIYNVWNRRTHDFSRRLKKLKICLLVSTEYTNRQTAQWHMLHLCNSIARQKYTINLTLWGPQLKPHSNGPRTIIQQYDCSYTGRWWAGWYIWYSEERPRRAGTPPSPLLAVPNITAHPSTASVPTSYYLMWHSALLRVNLSHTTYYGG